MLEIQFEAHWFMDKPGWIPKAKNVLEKQRATITSRIFPNFDSAIYFTFIFSIWLSSVLVTVLVPVPVPVQYAYRWTLQLLESCTHVYWFFEFDIKSTQPTISNNQFVAVDRGHGNQMNCWSKQWERQCDDVVWHIEFNGSVCGFGIFKQFTKAHAHECSCWNPDAIIHIYISIHRVWQNMWLFSICRWMLY